MIKNKLSIKFHSEPIYKQKYLKAKVRGFGGVIKTKRKYVLYLHCLHNCVMRMDKKPSAGLFTGMQIHMSRFIITELKSDSDSEVDSDLDSEKIEAKFDTKLMRKLEFDSNSDPE